MLYDLFTSLEEVQDTATRWLWSYNNERPHMGIGGITPAMKYARAVWTLLQKTTKKERDTNDSTQIGQDLSMFLG